MSSPESGWTALRTLVHARGAKRILIDGPSGAGKSTLALALLQFWPGEEIPAVIRMDDVYPGWDGLQAAGEHIGAEVLEPLSRGESGRWQRYDWERETLAEWYEVEPATPLIVEGSGVLTRRNAPFADLRLWLTADDELRKRRALLREKGEFDDYWDAWQRQFEAFLEREQPQRLADVTLDVTDWFAQARTPGE